MPFTASRWWRGYNPVSIVARLGEQICIGVLCRVNLRPFSAMPSIFGVRASELPAQPRLSDRCWSVQMTRKLVFLPMIFPRNRSRLMAGQSRQPGAPSLPSTRARCPRAMAPQPAVPQRTDLLARLFWPEPHRMASRIVGQWIKTCLARFPTGPTPRQPGSATLSDFQPMCKAPSPPLVEAVLTDTIRR